MSENQHYYTKNFGSYGNSEDNFVTNQEITVTITLREYRSLVSENAKYETALSELISKNLKHKLEVEKLKEKLHDKEDEV